MCGDFITSRNQYTVVAVLCHALHYSVLFQAESTGNGTHGWENAAGHSLVQQAQGVWSDKAMHGLIAQYVYLYKI